MGRDGSAHTAFFPSGSTVDWRVTAETGEYDIRDAAGIEFLTQACQATDRAEALAAQITADGEIIRGKNGLRVHPGIRDEVALRALVIRTLTKLGINYEPLRSAPGRPPSASAR